MLVLLFQWVVVVAALAGAAAFFGLVAYLAAVFVRWLIRGVTNG